jgi:hypothetical protein
MNSNNGLKKKEGESVCNDSYCESKEITFLATNDFIVE